LYKQRKAKVLPMDTAQHLEEAYFFLRRVEHMLQYREDEQTHLLSKLDEQRAGLAHAMGLDVDAFEEKLAAHRRFVSRSFQQAFRLAGMEIDEDSDAQVLFTGDNEPVMPDAMDSMPSRDHALTEQSHRDLQAMLDSPRMQALPR